MKIKRYFDLFERAAKKIKPEIEEEEKIKIDTHKDYISDVFLRLTDLGKYEIPISPWYNAFPFTFSINITYRNSNNIDLVCGIFDSFDDYYQFNDNIKRIIDQLSHDYIIKSFEVQFQEDDHGENIGGYYILTIEAKNKNLT